MFKLCSLPDFLEFEIDGAQAGWIKVIFEGELRWAEPCFPSGMNLPISMEFLKKYRENIGVWVTKALADNRHTQDMTLIWCGIKFLDGNTPPDLDKGDHPYRRTVFTENWEMHFVDASELDASTPHKFYVKHVPTGTSVKLDRTFDEELLRITDPVLDVVVLADPDKLYIKSGAGHVLEMSGNGSSLGAPPDNKIRLHHASGSIIEMLDDAVTWLSKDQSGNMADGSGNLTVKCGGGQKLEFTADGIKYNDKFLVHQGLLDWFQTYGATFCTGNLGAPAPINPAALAELVTALTSPVGTMQCNLTGVPEAPLAPPEEPSAPEEDE